MIAFLIGLIRSTLRFFLQATQTVGGVTLRNSGAIVQIAVIGLVIAAVIQLPTWAAQGVAFIDTLDTLGLAVGLVFAVCGYVAGVRFFETRERTSPSIIAAVLGIIGYLATSALINILAIVIAIIVLVLLLRSWQTVHAAVVQFAAVMGIRLRMRRGETFIDRGKKVTGEYGRRSRFIGTLPLDKRNKVHLLDEERTHYRDAISGLSQQHPYLDDENAPAPRSQQGFASWFDDSDEEELP